MFLSKLESKLFSFLLSKPQACSWNREDCLVEGHNQLSDTCTYVGVKKYYDKGLSQLTEKSNMFLNDYTTTS